MNKLSIGLIMSILIWVIHSYLIWDYLSQPIIIVTYVLSGYGIGSLVRRFVDYIFEEEN